jgi:hypothetical protein
VLSAQAALAKAQEGAETARQARDRQKRLVGEYERDISEIPEKLLPGAESAAKIAETRATQNVQRVVALDKETATLRQTLPIRQSGRQVAGGLRDLTTETETATQLVESLNQGRDKEAQMKQQMIAAARSGGPVTEEVMVAFRAQQTRNEQVARELAEHSKRIREMEGRPPRTQ